MKTLYNNIPLTLRENERQKELKIIAIKEVLSFSVLLLYHFTADTPSLVHTGGLSSRVNTH